ncbi:carbohydrate ABC transporter permease [Microlunatus soli]|uniref:Multiple sugar transport system permease protein n=1 Tax=Microlunatus soli TaxID=630515 RepID=A0A1H1YLG1_9ACTN|nr:carbohydrate ABC transporter permease [Microlunatus soli]SDT22272.1 multiple sugar transport system permease protein [Microlunatus soli]
MKHRTRERIVSQVVAIVVSLLFLAPIGWLALTALKDQSEVSALPVRWLPRSPQWHNFTDAMTMINFLAYARNSMIIATISAVLTTLSSAFVGFGFARLRARGSKLAFAILIGTMMLPTIITVIPSYIIFARLNLVNTYIPWVLWGLGGSAFMIFLFRQTFRGIPLELEDSAILDGCNYLQIWWRIYLPLSKATSAAVFLLTFVAIWGDYITPKLLLQQDTTTLAVAITSGYVNQQGQIINTLLAAGALLFALPVIVIFLLLQRYFVQGFATSGLK